ncbi:MAG: hypothetical protein WAM62_17020 [Pseudolabrys sp.]
MPDSLVKRRCVISIGDYEPTSVAQQFANFQRGLQRFSQIWKVATSVSPFKLEADGAIAVWHTETKAPNWMVITEFRLFNWSDIVKKDFQRWNFGRAWRAIRSITDFVVSGTCWRYFRLKWRFGLLFLYPLLAVLFAAIVSLWLSAFLGNLEVPYASLIAFLIGAVAIFSVFKWVDPVVLPRIVDLWVFLHELVHLEKTDLAERLGIFSQDLARLLESSNFDEILVVGHGIGAVLQPIIVDRAFWAMPEFGKNGRPVSLLSLGSLLLAVGLHPEGGWVVGPMSRVARDKWVYWAEYQAEEDTLSFAGINPVTELLSDHGKPVLQRIQFKEMQDFDSKGRFAKGSIQNHRQFVRANAKRYFYDYFMICCGPFDLRARFKYPEIMVSAFTSDGRLSPNR